MIDDEKNINCTEEERMENNEKMSDLFLKSPKNENTFDL